MANSVAPALLAYSIALILGASEAIGDQRLGVRKAFGSFDANGVSIRYCAQGSGEPVVLIHGLYSSQEINWMVPGIAGTLSERFQVITFDLPGHGGSDKPDGANAYGMQMVEDVRLLLDHLKIKKAHIVGYSLGGGVALPFIAKYPDRTISGTIAGWGWLRRGGALQAFWERIPTEGRGRTPPACLNGIAQLAMTEGEVKSIHLPVRVIVGSRDPVKRMYVAPLQSIRADWTVQEIDDAGHFNCIMKPEFATAISDWLDRNRSK